MSDTTTQGGVDLLTLEAVLEYCHNWFPVSVFTGKFTIGNGIIPMVEALRDGQYYRIVGSIFNDGLHQWGREDDVLTDETFSGAVWPLAIPPAVIAIAGEIKDWRDKYETAAASPFSSESFAGYSYMKASGTSQDGGTGGWQAVFAGRLARWRKIREAYHAV